MLLTSDHIPSEALQVALIQVQVAYSQRNDVKQLQLATSETSGKNYAAHKHIVRCNYTGLQPPLLQIYPSPYLQHNETSVKIVENLKNDSVIINRQ